MDGNGQFNFNLDDVIGALIHSGQNLAAHLSTRQVHSDWASLEAHMERMGQLFAIARAGSEAHVASMQAASVPSAQNN